LNAQTREREEVPSPHEVTRLGGWSPDGRYLALVQTPPVPAGFKPGDLKETWLALYDSADKQIRRLTNARGVSETLFFWTTTNSFLYATKPITNPSAASELFLGQLGQDPTNFCKVANYMPQFVVTATNHAAYVYKGNLFDLEIKPLPRSQRWGWVDSAKAVTQLTDWKPDYFDEIRWLRFASQTSNYLFCARPTNSTFRYLFEFNPHTKLLRQLSHQGTYNGQVLQDGGGFAYVGNLNNSFYLAVKPQNSSEQTNLFTQGSLVSYAVSEDGKKIFIHGAIGGEPQGIWEYTLAQRNLRSVVGTTKPFAASKAISLQEVTIKSFDGLEVPCFLLAPNTNSLVGQPRKHPAVIYVPPNTSRMQRSFGPRSQFLANIGFYFLAVNYRGVDGYGQNYAAQYDAALSAKDVLAAYHWLTNNPGVDPNNIFLFTMSGGTPITAELLASQPQIWRGVAIDKPGGGLEHTARFEPEKFPPLLLITGDQDPALASVGKFMDWAGKQGIEAQEIIYTNAAHITFALNSRKMSQKQVAEFYLRQLK
jgi:dipeptidyl aminopeptidase/acylaminoacyl peptidase